MIPIEDKPSVEITRRVLDPRNTSESQVRPVDRANEPFADDRLSELGEAWRA